MTPGDMTSHDTTYTTSCDATLRDMTSRCCEQDADSWKEFWRHSKDVWKRIFYVLKR